MTVQEKKMATKTVKRSTAKAVRSAAGSVTDKVRQFLVLRLQSDDLGQRVDSLKKELSAAIETEGYTDDKGHIWLDLDEPVEVDGFGRCKQLKREKRVIVKVDEDAAEKVLREKGLWVSVEEGGCVQTVEVMDEDAIRKAFFEGRITKAEFDRMFPQVVTYAFRPMKG